MFLPLSHWGIMTSILNLIGIFDGATPIGNYSIGIIGAKFVNYYNWLDYWDILFSYWSIPTIVLTNHQNPWIWHRNIRVSGNLYATTRLEYTSLVQHASDFKTTICPGITSVHLVPPVRQDCLEIEQISCCHVPIDCGHYSV